MKRTTQSGFTLIEMLVVIAIMAVLAGLIFPAIGKALLTAKRNTAVSEARAIAGAIEMFYKDYGYLPVEPAGQGLALGSPGNLDSYPEQQSKYFTKQESEKIVQVLTADPQNYNADHELNPRRKVYVDSDRAIKDGVMEDPWGSQYIIKLDRDYDGKVEYFSQPKQYNTRAIVVSPGPDRNVSTVKDNVANVILDQSN